MLFGSWVIRADVQRKLCVALQLEVAHHFFEGCAGGLSRRVEPPSTFGATKTPKTLLLNPHQLPAHGRLYRFPQSVECLVRACCREPKRSGSLWRIVLQGRMAWLPQKASPSLGVAEDVSRECVEFTCANLEVLSRILHNGRFLDCVLRPISGPRLSSGIAELGLFF